jgi:Flp pilus assembly protein TadG
VSSTTKRVQDGQILVLFAISATVIFTMAALAYDVGLVLVEQRDQQNAADAASLAGARYLPGDTATARARAEQIALENGFQDGVNSASVVIDFGSWSPGGGFTSGTGTGAIDVQITATRPSIFAGIIGRSGWDVSSHAVAVNQSSNTGPFAMLSLHPTACPAFRVEGTGIVNSNGNIQVNSACTTGDAAFRVAGTGALSMTAPGIGCNVVGGATFGGGVTHNDCNPANVSAPEVPDPYSAWSTPPIPAMPQAPQRWNPTTNLPWSPATAPPAGCPGSATPATAVDPQICLFGGSYAGQTWRLFPGYYPGTP